MPAEQDAWITATGIAKNPIDGPGIAGHTNTPPVASMRRLAVGFQKEKQKEKEKFSNGQKRQRLAA